MLRAACVIIMLQGKMYSSFFMIYPFISYTGTAINRNHYHHPDQVPFFYPFFTCATLLPGLTQAPFGMGTDGGIH